MNYDKQWVIDANIWIRLRDDYPSWLFDTVWQGLSMSIQEGRLQAPVEVMDEVSPETDDHWFEIWKREHQSQLIFDTDESLVVQVQQIVEEFGGKFVDPDAPQKNFGDPYLVGLAILNNASVVTAENYAKQPNTHVKIPDVCDHFNVDCFKLLDFLKEEIGKH